MKKQKIQLNETEWPLAPMRLKAIPLENGFGQKITVCSACSGSGRKITAVRDTESGIAGVPKREQKSCTARQSEKLARDGWAITNETCPECGGAGTRVAKVI